MEVSYNKLFKLLIDKNIKKTEMAKEAGISSVTLAKLSKNQSVSMESLLKICEILDCDISDIVEVVKKS